jgi:hypothetical protein
MGTVFVAHGNNNNKNKNKKKQQNYVIPQVNNTEVWLLKICVSEQYSWQWEGKISLNYFLLRMIEDTLSSGLFNFTFEYAFRKAQTNQEGLKFYVRHQHMCVCRWCYYFGWKHTSYKQNMEALVVSGLV